MKRTVKILLLSIFILIILSMLTCVNAATARISASKTSATVGDKVVITVSVNAAAWNVSVNGGGVSGSIVGYNDEAINQQTTKTYTLDTSTAGTYKVSITGDITDESSDYSTQVNDSVTVTVSKPAANNSGTTSSGGSTSSNSGGNTSSSGGSSSSSGGSTTSSSSSTSNNSGSTSNNTQKPAKSSNSRLSSLKIAEGAITPEFDKDTTEYAISVPNETTKLSISAVTDDSKATTKITGNEELKVGENVIEILVTAEDGTTRTYKITAIRAEAELNLQSLSIFYTNEKGEKTPLELTPVFANGVYEYTLGDIAYTIDKLIIEAVASRENANIEITGNEELKEGENIITIKVSVKDETGLEEQKTYTVKVNKEAAPVPPAPLTTMQKIQNWFNGTKTTVQAWIANNVNKILAGLLLISTTTLAGLTVYFVYDYKNYKKLIEKLAILNKTNLMEKANVALAPEEVTIEEVENTDGNLEAEENIKEGKGKRFK